MSKSPASTNAPRRRRGRDILLGYALIFPAFLILAVFAFKPLVRLVELSLVKPNRFGTGETYVGWSNIMDILTGDEFKEGLWITTKVVIVTVPAGLLLGLALALLANRKLRGIRIFQTIFSSTIATSVAVASVVFFGLINPEIGRFRDVRALSVAHSDTALRGIMLTSIWQTMGVTFVICLAALQAVPDEILEATRIDGFSAWRRITRIILPLISPALLVLTVILGVGAFQTFAQVDLLTAGGPAGSTETIVFKIFERQDPGHISEAAVMSLGLFVLTLGMTLIQFGVFNKRVHYGD
ncbi:MAG: sugar ABC transporter permease [Acidimicrobiales bacterium]|nr:sugar ABC transporter permease [Acidimicrobiales bacterium]